MTEYRKVSKIIFREDLYPRIEHDAELVQKYAEDLDILPPIEINQHDILIDGWHRWTGHKKAERKDIKVEVTKTESEVALRKLAIRRNNAFGKQLTAADKKKQAVSIYNMENRPAAEKAAQKEELAELFSVSVRTITDWLARSDKDAKEAARREAFDLWLACRTQDEIAEAVGYSQPSVAEFLRSIIRNGKSADSDKSGENGDDAEESASLGEWTPTDAQAAAMAHASEDFEKPIYNIWKQKTKSDGPSHAGNSEARWVDNLLYLYTQPFGIVVDPFAGGGSTIIVAKRRLRRYWVGDMIPVVEREKEIRKHDLIADGVPDLTGRWKDVQLIYLDPPYWLQAKGMYSDAPTNLANMPLEEFHLELSRIIKDFAAKLGRAKARARIALIIQPTQWKAPGRVYTDHVAAMIKEIGLPIEMRFSAPYESQQCNAQMVEWAKANKQCLVLTREIIVWRIGNGNEKA